MTRSLRTFAGVFLAVLSLATGIALAQAQPGKAKVTPRIVAPAGADVPRPAPAAPASDPRLDALLRAWEESSAKIKSLQGEHLRSRSNSVFATDARATGKFYFEAPDKGRIDLKGAPPEKGASSPLKDANGAPYALTADRDEKWVCDGEQVLMINEAEKQYESIPIPKEMQGKNIIESPLPFLFGMKVAEMKKRFQMELIDYNPTNKSAKIMAVPLQARDAQNFIRAEITLDTKNFIPQRVYLTDPAGTIVTRYFFHKVSVKHEGRFDGIREFFDLDGDPFAPNLRGYQKIQPPVEQLGGPVPNGAKNKIVPLNGKSTAPVFPPNTGSPRPNNGIVPRSGTQTGTTTSGQRFSPK